MGRHTELLNLNWKFLRGEEERAWYKGLDDSNWRNVTLPHDWSVEEPFSKEYSSGTGYLPGGIGWYRKKFLLPEDMKGKRVYITFEGVYNNSQVWCNSYYIGKRPYGYSTFTYDITDFITFGEENLISVKVNHKDIADSRWFTGSGIYRDVYLTITDQVHIDQYGVFVTTPQVTKEYADVSVNVRLTNETQTDESIDIKNTLVDADGNAIVSTIESYEISAESELEANQLLHVSNPHLWSPDTPYLYSVVTEIIKNGEIIDYIKTTTGIRWFEFDAEKGFFLNGINMKLKGVCIHHDAGALGAAVPQKVWERRLEAFKEMGSNAIRMSHNPPAPNLLDLCDQMGFLVIDEAFDEWEGVKNKWSTGHNVYPPKHFGYYEDFPQWSEIDMKEMVLRDRNHPSIIMWSIGNEIDYPNDPYCHPYFETMTGNNDANKPAAERKYDPNKPNAERLVTISKRLVKYVKECDTTRPVTAALAFPELSNLTGLSDTVDIVGYNYKEHLYEEDLKQYPDRVIYGSENGASMEAWLAVRDNDAMSAQFIWTGIDFLGEAKGWPIRASQAGFMDLAGFKKPNYFHRQSLWSTKPMAFLSVVRPEDVKSNHNPRWYASPHWNWNTGEQLQVLCYTNCDEAELFLNGKSLGSKHRGESDEFIRWEVMFEEGTIEVVAKHKSGKNVSYELITNSEPEKIDMSSDSLEMKANGLDIAHIEMEILDVNGKTVYLANNEISLSIEGPGEILGLENGNAQDLTPYSSKKRQVHNGKLLAYIRSTTKAGEIIVTATSPGLPTASVIIQAK